MIKGFLPVSSNELKKLGWKQPDVIIVTGDAYIDHPNSFVARTGKFLDKNGIRTAVLEMPDINNDKNWTDLGKPKLFFLVITGEEDSMVSNYTPYLKLKSTDQYLPGNKKLNRPDRALIKYSNKIKQLYKNTKIVAAGAEAAGRMASHYDFWSDKIRKPVLFDAKADVVLYGIPEFNLLKLSEQMRLSNDFKNINNMDGVAYISKTIPEKVNYETLASFEEITNDKQKFLEHEKILFSNQNPYRSKILVQKVMNRYLIINRPQKPFSTNEIDSIYSSRFTLRPHPKYKSDIPAYNRYIDQMPTHIGCLNMISDVQDIFLEGRFISSRSKNSIIKNIIHFTKTKMFNKIIRNFYGSRSNYYGITLRDTEKCAKCKRLSCTLPEVCRNLSKGTRSMIEISSETDKVSNVRNNFYASSVDIDLLLSDNDAFKEYLMNRIENKCIVKDFTIKAIQSELKGIASPDKIKKFFEDFTRRAGEYAKKKEIAVSVSAGYPGETYENALDNILFIEKNDVYIDQIKPFIPLPMTIAACQYFTGKDPFERGEVEVNKKISEKKNTAAIYNYKNKSNSKTIIRIINDLGRKKDITNILK